MSTNNLDFIFLILMLYTVLFISIISEVPSNPSLDYILKTILVFSIFQTLEDLFDTTNLIDFIVSFETIAYAFCGLVINSRRIYSLEAVVKYFTIHMISTILLLTSLLLISVSTGTTNLIEVAVAQAKYLTQLNSLNFNNLSEVYSSLILAMFFLIFSFFVKLGTAPFHIWFPDIFSGIHINFVAIYSILIKPIYIIIFLKIIYWPFCFFLIPFKIIFFFFGLVSIFVGCLGAFYQTKLKRFLAYSSINHLGFILLSIGDLHFIKGLLVTVIYILIYTAANIALFGVISQLKVFNNQLDEIIELGYLNFKTSDFKYKKNLINFVILFIFLTLAGFPPTAGFYMKFNIFGLLIYNKLFGILLISMLFAVFSVLYYFRIMRLLSSNIYTQKNSHKVCFNFSSVLTTNSLGIVLVCQIPLLFATLNYTFVTSLAYNVIFNGIF